MEYQVTLFCNTGKYRPMSTIVRVKEEITTPEAKKALIEKGAQKICYQHGLSGKDLKKDGYIYGKVRVYDKEKLDKEAKERYNKIKEEKYASGEWKRPKKEGTRDE